MPPRARLRTAPVVLGAAIALLSASACPTDDTTDSGGAGSSSTTAAGSSTGSSSSSTTTPVSDSSTGSPGCDPDNCEALDVEACTACDPNDCAVLSGYPWQQETMDEWCLEGAVPIACQVGNICFDYYLTLCDAEGQAYYVDMGCPQFDIAAAGFTECDPPVVGEPFCPADTGTGTGGGSGGTG